MAYFVQLDILLKTRRFDWLMYSWKR